MIKDCGNCLNWKEKKCNKKDKKTSTNDYCLFWDKIGVDK